MYTKHEIQEIKESVSIMDYLDQKGFEPYDKVGRQYVYHSPISGETGTPSFFVDPQQNVFADFSGGNHSNKENQGDLFRLIMILERVNFMKAVQLAMSAAAAAGSATTEGRKQAPQAPEKENTTFIKRITKIYAYPLKNYLAERAIPASVYELHLREIHYYNHAGDFYALGFKNNSEGYELRSKHFKGCIGRKDVTTLGNPAAAKVLIFEGFFDFLSWMPTPERLKRNYVIVLNSLSLINRLPDLSRYDVITMFLDNDEPGKMQTEVLQKRYPGKVENGSLAYFPKHKDYNDFIISKNLGK